MKEKSAAGKICFLLLPALLLAGCLAPQGVKPADQNWRGVHIWLDRESSARELIRTMPRLAAAGANVVVIEVNYSFEFKQHPELRDKRFITRTTAHRLAAAARRNGIRLIPEFNCLGHQSFSGRIAPLFKAHPEFSETPLSAMHETNFYSLSWCPRAPGLDEIVFSLIDELAEGFEADAIHVGMDEVYYIGEDRCPRCHGADPAELFTEQVKTLHAHIVGEKKWQMLMWADRPIGPKFQGYCRFDNAHNDLSASLNSIPRDIVMCDWHYEWKKAYPSVPLLAGEGFQVWPSGFLPLKAARAFSDYAQAHPTNVIGYLATTWTTTNISKLPDWPPIKEILPRWENFMRTD
ncbi:MAG: family 20 glycosylhydrolase [Verrucomicrobiae bacterium]|nr:family 20 glycosylhydrolase [Verrucomicrobiae bacterium]